jgi:DNA repair protein RecN (Recombination protein N)
MLVDLSVRDLAIIETVRVSFQPGFNVISGETGAGKSILLHALGLVLGARASSDAVRAGAKQARVDASFEVDDAVLQWLHEQDLPVEPGEPVLLRRVVSAAGRSRSYVNDAPAPASCLRALGTFLVDFASQHESAVLLDEAHHRDILDRYAEVGELATEVAGLVGDLRDSRDDLAALEQSARDRGAKMDLLQYQLRELEALEPTRGEEETLEREAEVLRRAEQLRQSVAGAEGALYSGEGAAVDAANVALATLRPLGGLDDEIDAVTQQLEGALYELEDVSRTLSGLSGRFCANPARLEEVDDRLQTLRACMRKHGTDEDGLVQLADELAEEYSTLGNAEDRLGSLREEVQRRLEHATAAARRLSDARHAAAQRLESAIAAALEELAMAGARFAVVVEDDPAGLGETGLDRVAFRLSANAGEPLRPLAKVASGGELSRVLLAVKEVLGNASPAGSFVLDEIDAGIGGRTADVVGRKLAGLAIGRQLIAITHLPQIAALADAHYVVGKAENDGRTTAWVRCLDEAERLDEVARMVAGEQHTEHSRALAGEMLDKGLRLSGSGELIK